MRGRGEGEKKQKRSDTIPAVVVPNSVIIAPFVAPKSKPLMSANG